MSITYDRSFAAEPARKTEISTSLQRLAMHFKGYFRFRRHSAFAMTQDLIRYDIIAQDALRSVIRTVLKGVAKDGLPGEHHFYISFATRAPGVRLSQRLRDQYPEEMTIVLQHQFWDLDVTEHTFSVGLSFNGIPERLLVPYSAIKRFFDPTVQFGLEFEVEMPEATGTDIAPAPAASVPTIATDAEATFPANGDEAPDTEAAEDAKAEAVEKAEAAEPDADAAETEGADVVSLDAFRKKK